MQASLYIASMLHVDKKHQRLLESLRRLKTLAHAVHHVVAANASDPSPMQFYAPMAGAAIGEYFRDTGRPALYL